MPYTCLACDSQWERKSTKGQTPLWCPDCTGRYSLRECQTCGERKPITKRSKRCRDCWGMVKLESRVAKLSQCGWCGSIFALDKGKKFCSDTCRTSRRAEVDRNARGPLRAAAEDCDHDAVISLVKMDCRITDAGCWEWTRVTKHGYPAVLFGRRHTQVHRLVLEAKMRAPLGSQHAHHMCANRSCVNPDHLQPVTHRDNTAEMLARHSYLARIRELEAAIAELDPSHPLLHVVSVA